MSGSPEQLHRDFEDAFNRHDIEAVLALYEPDAVMITGGAPARGVAALREAYLGFFAMRPAIQLRTLAVHRAGNLAMLHGTWSLHGSEPGGAPIQNGGRNTEVARLQSDGRWLFVIDNPSVPQE